MTDDTCVIDKFDQIVIKPNHSSNTPDRLVTLNEIADKYLVTTDHESQLINQCRFKLQQYLDAHNTIKHLHQLASNSATNGHWRSSYHRNDLTALFNNVNPGDVNEHTVLDGTMVPGIPSDADYKSMWPPNINTVSNHTILRYIRARKGKLDSAVEQLCKTLAWRMIYGVDELARLPVSPAHILLRSLTTAVVHPVYDKHHRPVFMDRSGEMVCYKEYYIVELCVITTLTSLISVLVL